MADREAAEADAEAEAAFEHPAGVVAADANLARAWTIDGHAVSNHNSPLVSVMVPCNPLVKQIVSAPEFVLAHAIAARNEPVPQSFRFRTMNVLSKVRSSNVSKWGTNDRRGAAIRRPGLRRRTLPPHPRIVFSPWSHAWTS